MALEAVAPVEPKGIDAVEPAQSHGAPDAPRLLARGEHRSSRPCGGPTRRRAVSSPAPGSTDRPVVYLHLGASEQKLARMRESVLALTRGWDRDRVRAIVADTLESVVEPIIYGEALQMTDNAKPKLLTQQSVGLSPFTSFDIRSEFLNPA